MTIKILILGLGNPLFGDDGVGCRVARLLRTRIAHPDVAVQEFAGAGLDVLDLVIGYDKVIIIDAVQGLGGKTGTIHQIGIDQISAAGLVPTHQMDFLSALDLGSKAALNVPRDIFVYAIEAGVIDGVTAECSPAVDAAVPICVDLIIRELRTIPIRCPQANQLAREG